jgi:glycogen operon protein
LSSLLSRQFFWFQRANAGISAGSSHPLGATWDGRGSNFALFSANAEKVELCLFDRSGKRETRRVTLPERTEDVWHGYLHDVTPGQLYGYRVQGPYEPERGLRFNPNKLLVDPYAKSLAGRLVWSDAHFGYRTGHARADLSFDRRDNARGMPKSIVIDETAAPRRDETPRIPWEDTIIYEAHVKGLTRQREDVPPEWRGTYRGLSTRPVIDHLKRLGVTAIELLPVHAFIDDRQLMERGLSNYWGYNTLGFFAPEARYATENALADFRATVARLHDADIEVILDVVYNHTAEGNHLGPTLSFRGIDNTSYYRLSPSEPRYYDNVTGTGNSLDLAHPRVLQLVMDSLRHWVQAFHVDGFRFDLATTLGRHGNGFDRGAPFFAAIRQDPVLAGIKLIAEPWDLGPEGYQVGHFPPGWSEWNDRYRGTLRRYWAGTGSLIGDVGGRMTASSDLFNHDGRATQASINHVTVHDGFTLADLVSYNGKHNEANGEGNRDGSDDNNSTNCGVEGPTSDAKILALRRQLRRNQLASLMLAQGVPLMLAGDEVGNSQHGNNNPYCQDNEVGWTDWSKLGDPDDDMSGFIARVTTIRRRFPQIRTRRWVEGHRADGSYGVLWLTPKAAEMVEKDWQFPEGRFLAYVLGPAEPGGEPVYVVLNAAPESIAYTLPKLPEYARWTLLLDTTIASGGETETHQSGTDAKAPPRSVLVFAGAA